MTSAPTCCKSGSKEVQPIIELMRLHPDFKTRYKGPVSHIIAVVLWIQPLETEGDD